MCNNAATCSINDVLSTNCLYFALCNLCMSIPCDKQRNIVNLIIICAGRQRSGRAGVWHQTERFEEHWLTRSPRRTESRNSAKRTCRGTKLGEAACGTFYSHSGIYISQQIPRFQPKRCRGIRRQNQVSRAEDYEDGSFCVACLDHHSSSKSREQ